MESNSKNEKIIKILQDIILLLEKYEELSWSEQLIRILKHYQTSHDITIFIAEIKKTLTSGAGSLSDVVLYKDGRALITENNKLQDLLNRLYEFSQ